MRSLWPKSQFLFPTDSLFVFPTWSLREIEQIFSLQVKCKPRAGYHSFCADLTWGMKSTPNYNFSQKEWGNRWERPFDTPFQNGLSPEPNPVPQAHVEAWKSVPHERARPDARSRPLPFVKAVASGPPSLWGCRIMPRKSLLVFLHTGKVPIWEHLLTVQAVHPSVPAWA